MSAPTGPLPNWVNYGLMPLLNLVVAFAILTVSLAVSLRDRLRDGAADPAAGIQGGAADAVVVPQPPHVPQPPRPERAPPAPRLAR